MLGAPGVIFPYINDPTTLEALATREALALALDLYVNRMVIASDYKVIVGAIKSGSGANYGAVIHEIIQWSSSFVSSVFKHEFRTSNVEAHNLAKHVLNLGVGRYVWLGQPGQLAFVPVSILTY